MSNYPDLRTPAKAHTKSNFYYYLQLYSTVCEGGGDADCALSSASRPKHAPRLHPRSWLKSGYCGSGELSRNALRWCESRTPYMVVLIFAVLSLRPP